MPQMPLRRYGVPIFGNGWSITVGVWAQQKQTAHDRVRGIFRNRVGIAPVSQVELLADSRITLEQRATSRNDYVQTPTTDMPRLSSLAPESSGEIAEVHCDGLHLPSVEPDGVAPARPYNDPDYWR